MNRPILLAILCVGIVVRYSPAQEYIRSRYLVQDRFDTRNLHDAGIRFDEQRCDVQRDPLCEAYLYEDGQPGLQIPRSLAP